MSSGERFTIKTNSNYLFLSFSLQEVGNLKFLEFLDASENRIEWIADEVGECDSLTDLHLTTNLLTQLPENLCKLFLFLFVFLVFYVCNIVFLSSFQFYFVTK